ncbi:stage II sporulation protein R [Thermobrachium celere]|uniref:Stage II sporulation protein required for processing of pro-sigma-E (SpoIIR) n=1 Tax=Thermobrachium celere DSM 8682 TaxID=941824 RepID=R7RPJ0_9CLOT|nr:stage II sporulation protein R [Thermobrachium celere]CDF57238.1 Stage II sporulation protein required for processing of pro-sigma-E (SpoIIR) [Thermobrachium celere DSM 8682]
MKKYLSILILLALLVSFMYANKKTNTLTYKDKLIRFHVIANSDSKGDQNVKLKVRDAVLKELGPKLQSAKNKDEAIKIITDNIDKIEEISNKVLKENKYKYTAKASLGTYTFPIKSYGDITLSEGEYTALRIVLGEGGGKNWWCVMFPPLCFIDITRGLTTEETEKELYKVLDGDEVVEVMNVSETKEDKHENVVFRFKIVEIIQQLLK